MVDAKSAKKIPSTKWRLLITSDKKSLQVSSDAHKATLEFSGNYLPNKYHQIVRKTIKSVERTPISMQLVTEPPLELNLELFLFGNKVIEVRGKGCCTVPLIILPSTNKKEKVLRSNNSTTEHSCD